MFLFSIHNGTFFVTNPSDKNTPNINPIIKIAVYSSLRPYFRAAIKKSRCVK